MASTTSHILPTDLTITSSNGIPAILTKLTSFEQTGKVLQIVYNLNSTTAPTTLSATSFNVPSYIRYTNDVEYSTFTHPITLTNAFALKIFAYITIDNAGLYTFTTNATSDKIKLFLNNFLVLDNITQTSSTADLFLNVGTYLLYIEKIAPVSDAILTLKLTPKSVATPVSINSYIKSNFRLLDNAKLSRDSAITTYCTPSANLFSTETTNICNISLNETDLLNNILLNTHCFPAADGIAKNIITKKLSDNCKTTYNKTTLNSNIKNNFNSKYQTWANKVVTDNTINNNKDALEEYLDGRTPNENEFSFVNNIKTYCENDLDVKKNYNVTTQTDNNLCKKIYGRTYTGTNKTNVDISIQKIKNNFCDPAQTITNIKNPDCINEYKNKDDLKNSISNYCFPTDDAGRYLFKNTNDGKYNTNCRDIHRQTGLNANIKSELDTQYQGWASKVATNTATTFDDHDAALNEYIVDRSPTQAQLFGTSNTVTDKLTSYCESKISPNNTKYEADNNTNNMCNTLYNNSTLNTHPKIKSSIDKIKTNYCTANGADGKPRYETDSNCKNDYTSLLSSTLTTRCVPNNTFTYSDPWCVTTSNTNINNTSDPFAAMRTARTNALKNEASKIEVKDYLNKKILNNNNYEYAITTYNSISDPANKKLSDDLLTTQLFQYCENKEPNYPTDTTSQCKGIYDTYKTNVAVSTSRNQMRDELCKLNTNITTDNDDANANNTFKCKTTVFDTTNNLDKFAPTVNAYCNTGTNIATSNECKDYYTNIENKILEALNLKINSAPVSAFSNKFYHINSDMVEDYDKKLELSNFQNGSDGQPVDDIQVGNSGEEIIPAIYYVNVPQSCKQDDESIEYHDSSWLSLLLFFIFILLIVGFCSSCMYYKKKLVNKEETK